MSIFQWVRARLGLEKQVCKHERDDIWPDEEEGIWYLLDKRTGREYWCEYDAVYVKLRATEKDFICTGCGKETTIESAEQIGGEDAIKRKDEMSDEELASFQEEVHCGAFVNSLPKHRKRRLDRFQRLTSNSGRSGGSV